jgi:hypothetical protein
MRVVCARICVWEKKRHVNNDLDKVPRIRKPYFKGNISIRDSSRMIEVASAYL